MRRSSGGSAHLRRPSNVYLLGGLSVIFFTYFYFALNAPSGITEVVEDDFEEDSPSRLRQKRELIRDRPARFRHGQSRKSLDDVEREQRDAVERYKEKHGGSKDDEVDKKRKPADKDDAREGEGEGEKQTAKKRRSVAHDMPPIDIQDRKKSRDEAPKLRIAIISAYRGDRYNYMAKLSGETKKKYAQMHGYTFIEDNDLIPEQSTWSQRSAIRTKCFQKHFEDFDYMFWTDVDIFFTNPFVTLEEIIEAGRGAHVICSKDWGNVQVNPGSMIVKNSEFTRKFIVQWEDAIDRVTDDLRAFEEVMKEHPEYEGRKVRFVSQQILNPYHDVETENGKLVKKPHPDPNGHELWNPDVLLVHIVNCLRTSRGDCHLLADHFYRIAEKKYSEAGYPLEPYLDNPDELPPIPQ